MAMDDMKINIKSSNCSTLNILELCEIQYDPSENISEFYDKFKGIVCDNLKKKGDKFGFKELLLDEILSPTFEDFILLWCLDKINPNLSSKIKPAFNHRLNAGLSISEFRNDIFQYFSEKDMIKKEKSKLICDKCKECKCLQVTKKDPEQFLESLDDMLDIKQDIDDFYNEDDTNIKGERDEDYVYDPTEPYIQINGKGYDKDFSANNSEDDNDSFNEVDKKVIRKKACSKLNNNPTKCDICSKTFAGERRLKEHMQRKHDPANKISPKTIFSCKLCQEVFNNNDDLKKHRSEAHKPELKIEICPFCGKTINAYSKKRHLLTHTSDIKCRICHEKFNNHEELEIHTRKHEENPNYRMSRKKNIKCETCNRCFANVQDYGHHICKHYDCDICEKQFLMKRNLEVHKKFHGGEQIFSCDLCEALFLKRKALYCHKRATHDPDKKKYKCDICGKAFLNPCKLERHNLIHTSERPLKCERCPKTFKEKDKLRYHIMEKHNGETSSIQCITCDLRFRDSFHMKQHRESDECGFKSLDLAATKQEN